MCHIGGRVRRRHREAGDPRRVLPSASHGCISQHARRTALAELAGRQWGVRVAGAAGSRWARARGDRPPRAEPGACGGSTAASTRSAAPRCPARAATLAAVLACGEGAVLSHVERRRPLGPAQLRRAAPRRDRARVESGRPGDPPAPHTLPRCPRHHHVPRHPDHHPRQDPARPRRQQRRRTTSSTPSVRPCATSSTTTRAIDGRADRHHGRRGTKRCDERPPKTPPSPAASSSGASAPSAAVPACRSRSATWIVADADLHPHEVDFYFPAYRLDRRDRRLARPRDPHRLRARPGQGRRPRRRGLRGPALHQAPDRRRPGHGRRARQSGMFPCFRFGACTRLVSSVSSAVMTFGRVSWGTITSST